MTVVRLKSKPLPSLNLVVFLSTGFSKDLPITNVLNPAAREGSAILGRFGLGVPSLGTWTARSLRVATT